MELSKAKIKELVDAIARDTRIDNIVAAEGYTREFVEDFAREYADEICDKRKEHKGKFNNDVEKGRIYGIDVSAWQGVIEWNRVKRSINGKFVMLRAAYGEEPDRRFEENYRGATEAEIPVGVYVYTLALNEQEAVEEADRLLDLIRDKKLSYPVALDIEESSQAALGRERVSAIINAFCSRVERAGYYVSVYSYASFLETLLTDEIKSKYDLWVADLEGVPSLNFGMRQYSFKGRVAGIKGLVDLDYAVKDYPKIIENL